MSFLEESWEEREEYVYKQMLGDIGPGIYPLSKEIFDQMNATGVDPRWLTHGVFKCPPTTDRKTWAYITSGMSNPWESDVPEEYSGLGVEFLIETANEEVWAIELLQTLMAYNLLLASKQMGDFPALAYGHRVPLALSDSIKTMMFTHPINFPISFSIKSGKVDLLQVVGITKAEHEEAKQTSSAALAERLVSCTGGLLTCKTRACIV